MIPLLRDGIFWVAVVCCVVATAAILRSTVASTSDQERPTAARHRAVEIAYAILPAIALVAVLAATWQRIR